MVAVVVAGVVVVAAGGSVIVVALVSCLIRCYSWPLVLVIRFCWFIFWPRRDAHSPPSMVLNL